MFFRPNCMRNLTDFQTVDQQAEGLFGCVDFMIQFVQIELLNWIKERHQWQDRVDTCQEPFVMCQIFGISDGLGIV